MDGQRVPVLPGLHGGPADDVDGAPGPWTFLAATAGTSVSDSPVDRKVDRWYRVRSAAWSWTSAELVGRVRTLPGPADG